MGQKYGKLPEGIIVLTKWILLEIKRAVWVLD